MTSPNKAIFATNLKRLRNEKDIKQWELAKRLDVGRSTVASWESTANDNFPEARYLHELAAIFGCSVDELLGREVASIPSADLQSRWPLLSTEHRQKAAKLAAMPGANIPSDATDDIIDILWAAVQTAITVTGAVTKKAAPKGGSLQEDD